MTSSAGSFSAPVMLYFFRKSSPSGAFKFSNKIQKEEESLFPSDPDFGIAVNPQDGAEEH